MDINLALNFRLTPDATSCQTLQLFELPAMLEALEPTLRHVSQEALDTMDVPTQTRMYTAAMKEIVSLQEALGLVEPVACPVYCAGGCGGLMHMPGTLTPRHAFETRSLRVPALAWNEMNHRPIAYLCVAVHCMNDVCIATVRRLYHEGTAELRRQQPDMILRRTCAGCGKADTPEVKFKRCTGCHVPAYCSAACQLKDWPTHRAGCAPVAKE